MFVETFVCADRVDDLEDVRDLADALVLDELFGLFP